MILSRRWWLLAAAAFVPLGLLGWMPHAGPLALAWIGSLVVATMADCMLLPRETALEASRSMAPHLSLGSDNVVTVSVRNRSDRDMSLVVRDEPPAGMVTDWSDVRCTTRPGGGQAISYHVAPNKRGDFRYGDIWVKIAGRLGLIWAVRKIDAAQDVRVYPNLLETAKFQLMARRGRLQQVGIRAARLQGAGREFESLREYQTDDDYRRIDWKATARRGRLTSRQYEVERSQTVILAIDVGRTMLAETGGIAKLDHAVNAALLLAYVATLADDRVGLLVFSDTVHQWVPPRKGQTQVYRVLDALYNATATFSEPDYSSAFAYMGSRWRRRSLVVCFTDLWDPDSSRRAVSELASLQPRHLVACVTVMDSKVLRAADQAAVTIDDAYRQAVALQVLDDRARATGELRRRGVLVVDTPAEQLSAQLVNRYLEVKERMQL